MMRPVLHLAADAELRTAEAVETLSAQFDLTEEERSHLLPSGRQATMANRVHWAIAYLAKAGPIERVRRGVYTATAEGKSVLTEPPHRIDIKFLSQFARFQAFRTASKSKDGTIQSEYEEEKQVQGTPEERIDNATAELHGALTTEILERTRAMSPRAFEKLIVDLMVAMGYGASGTGVHVGKSGDGGIDGIISEDALGLDLIDLQAKRHAEGSVIGVEKIREFAGTLDERGATKGVFVTTSHFAPAARQYVARSPKRINLMEGNELAELMVKHGVAVRIYRTIDIKKIDTDYFEDLEG